MPLQAASIPNVGPQLWVMWSALTSVLDSDVCTLSGTGLDREDKPVHKLVPVPALMELTVWPLDGVFGVPRLSWNFLAQFGMPRAFKHLYCILHFISGY